MTLAGDSPSPASGQEGYVVTRNLETESLDPAGALCTVTHPAGDAWGGKSLLNNAGWNSHWWPDFGVLKIILIFIRAAKSHGLYQIARNY